MPRARRAVENATTEFLTDKRICFRIFQHDGRVQAVEIDEKFPKIAKDPRNLRLGISADGVDVNRGNRHHCVWPVLTLVDDLHTLFETRVDTYDASTKDNFNLCVIVLWTINDYLAFGTLCGYPYSGFKGCVVCGKDTNCVRLSASSKQSYVGHRRYLPYNHPFRKQKKAFNGQQEFLLAPNPMTEEQIYNKIQKQKRNTTEEEGSSSQVNGQNGAYWKKFNIWYQKLRYWRHNSVPHCIDFMHVEKNVAESLVEILLNVLGKTKDEVNAQLDLAELGVKPELFAMLRERVSNLQRKCIRNFYQNSGVSVEAIDLHISKEVATTRQSFYYGVLQEIWVLDYRFRQIPLFKYDWVNHRAGGVKRDTTLGCTLVDLNNIGHKVDLFILALKARQVFYVKD
ncbi:putative transposon, En/Spm-like protein [Tanacetum coccineum]